MNALIAGQSLQILLAAAAGALGAVVLTLAGPASVKTNSAGRCPQPDASLGSSALSPGASKNVDSQ